MGFRVIRATKNNSMLSLMRNNRYIDICFFSTNRENIGYEQKIFPINFYKEFINYRVNNRVYIIPKKSSEIIKYSYNL